MILFPPAKINIGLYVIAKRSDGYHDIETLFYPIGFSDILEIIPKIETAPGTIDFHLSGIDVGGDVSKNLVVRAYQMLDKRFQLPAVEVYLHKIIPVGSGLGGGSSDGAFMLRGLNNLFNLGLTTHQLQDFAAQLGSDCPFFVDPVPSIAMGRGEILERADLSLKGYWLYLFRPPGGISTANAYGRVTLSGPGVPSSRLAELPVREWRSRVLNAFEPVATKAIPEIVQIKESVYKTGAVYSSLTGSGSAIYGLFDHEIQMPKDLAGFLIWKEQF